MPGQQPSHTAQTVAKGLNALREAAILEPLIGAQANGDIHDTSALKFEERDLLIVSSSGRAAKKQARNLMDTIPSDDSIAHGSKYIALICANSFLRRDKDRIGAPQGDFVEFLTPPRFIAVCY